MIKGLLDPPLMNNDKHQSIETDSIHIHYQLYNAPSDIILTHLDYNCYSLPHVLLLGYSSTGHLEPVETIKCCNANR